MDTHQTVSQGMARAVAAALTGAGLSQRDAASATGIPLTTLSRRLTGRSPFTVTELAELATVAGTTVSALALAAERVAA